MHDTRAVGCEDGEICCYGQCGDRAFFGGNDAGLRNIDIKTIAMMNERMGVCILKTDTCPSFASSDLNIHRKHPTGTDCTFLPDTPLGYDCCTIFG